MEAERPVDLSDNQRFLVMSVLSVLTRLARTFALLVLFVAAVFFLIFALTPSIELLPDGMDWLVGILLATFLIVWFVAPLIRR